MTNNSEKEQTVEADPRMILIIELVDKDFIIGIINMLKKICFTNMKRLRILTKN